MCYTCKKQRTGTSAIPKPPPKALKIKSKSPSGTRLMSQSEGFMSKRPIRLDPPPIVRSNLMNVRKALELNRKKR
jgi:hypothetical protein